MHGFPLGFACKWGGGREQGQDMRLLAEGVLGDDDQTKEWKLRPGL